MKNLTAEQLLFLEHMAAGYSVKAAARAIGRSSSAPWGWAKRYPAFLERFVIVYPNYRRSGDTAPAVKPAPAPSTNRATLHQLAMQRLDREIRTDGPNAVIAAAAVILIVPQVTTPNTIGVEPDGVAEVADTPEQLELTPPAIVDPLAALSGMFYEVFPVEAPRTMAADTSIMRHYIEQYFACNLGNQFSVSARNISRRIAKLASDSFEVARHRTPNNHTNVYLVPQPKVRG